MRSIRALTALDVPLLLANIQPERTITADWDMDNLTYNQGIHGAQDQANALVRADVPFSVITGDWRSEGFEQAFEDWARAARGVAAPRPLRRGGRSAGPARPGRPAVRRRRSATRLGRR